VLPPPPEGKVVAHPQNVLALLVNPLGDHHPLNDQTAGAPLQGSKETGTVNATTGPIIAVAVVVVVAVERRHESSASLMHRLNSAYLMWSSASRDCTCLLTLLTSLIAG